MTKLRFAALAALSFCATNANAVTVENFLPPDAGNWADIWTFYCPTGGTYSASVVNSSSTYDAAVHDTDLITSALDPRITVYDSKGALVGFDDDGDACGIASHSTGANACPKITDDACAPGTRHYLVVDSFGNFAGGAYSLTVTAADANMNALTDAQVKLGGGPKPKVIVPAVFDPNKSPARAAPLINDSKQSW